MRPPSATVVIPEVAERLSGTQGAIEAARTAPGSPLYALCAPAGMTGWVHLAMAIAMILVALALTPAYAVQPDEVLKDPALEARARHLSQELRCLVCQNQSIDDSNAELARDLRVLVRERLAAGDSDRAVLAFVEARYGEFVLLRPPFKAHTLLLWLTPLLLLAGTAAYLFHRSRTRPPVTGATAATAPLTPAEQQRLNDLLGRNS
jgi:cytochrome c-type biogenesis protein CcmH